MGFGASAGLQRQTSHKIKDVWHFLGSKTELHYFWPHSGNLWFLARQPAAVLWMTTSLLSEIFSKQRQSFYFLLLRTMAGIPMGRELEQFQGQTSKTLDIIIRQEHE